MYSPNSAGFRRFWVSGRSAPRCASNTDRTPWLRDCGSGLSFFCSRLRVQDSEFRVWGLGFEFWGLVARVEGL